ncbi:hypothetical protein [Collinsella sp. An7]|uniref:hypothetical protein n=1 Tax=Collinsella sp. An7 TaxID=1965651 RepID=UPI0013024EE2|nr:hypothetical protein [Collinsella sp. An7]
MDHTCLLLNTTTKEYEEFERWAQRSGMKKIDLFRQMMGEERRRRAQSAAEG